MGVVLRTQRKSRLAKLIDQPGGVSVGVALAQAQANLKDLQARGVAIIAGRIAALEALPPPPPGDPDPLRRLTEAYDLSNAIIDAAGPFEMVDLCTIAAGLCDVLDSAPEDRPFDWRIVTVHARSMQLILGLPPEAVEDRAVILDRLRQLQARHSPESSQSSEG